MNKYYPVETVEEANYLINNKNKIVFIKNDRNKVGQKKSYFNFTYNSLKYFIFLLCVLLFLNNNKLVFVEIDNEVPLYEENLDFSNYSTDIKAIAFFIPHFHLSKEYHINFTEWKDIKNGKPLYLSHYQPRIPLDEKKYLGYYDLTNPKVLKKQAELAKKHGIYGFGIYYYWLSGNKYFNEPLDVFINNKDIDINFFLIWMNENWIKNLKVTNEEEDEEEEYNEKDPVNFIKDINKYFSDERYIKIKDKYVIGIYDPFNIINLNEVIQIWRDQARELGIGELFILVSLKNYNITNVENVNLFDGAYQFPPKNINDTKNRIAYTPFYLYTSILYNDEIEKIGSTNFTLYKGMMLQYDNSPKIRNNYTIFKEYSPELFYMLNKKIIKWTKEKYDEESRFIFINAWNNWGEGTYLEPDQEYGFASLNAFSKALFNLSYIEKVYNYFDSKNKCHIAVQAHVHYDDLIMEVINKVNNIPKKYDLFITTNSYKKKRNIEVQILKYSTASKYEIMVMENKGRDVLPFLTQMKKKIKKYKYILHVHAKKSVGISLGNNWKNYLLNNLLGSPKIISEIFIDFERYHKLGIIFPEYYYEFLIRYKFILREVNKYYMDLIMKKLNINIRVGHYIYFPMGNMFWAKTKAIYQIFNIDLKEDFPEEPAPNDDTIMHGIERIWVYLAKYNGYYFKKIFKSLK